jgi:Uma2 family endonuclease
MLSLLKKLKNSPQLPLYAQELQKLLKTEDSERQNFYASVKEEDKVEFINGKVIFQSPVMRRHFKASDWLYTLVISYVTRHNLGETAHEKAMIRLSRNDYEPDICFWKKEKAQHFTEDQMLFPAPDFVVEVLSKGTIRRDRGVKKEDYAAHGIGEYWIIDPIKKYIEQYLLENEKYVLKKKYGLEDEIQSLVIEGFVIPVRAIFEKTAFQEQQRKI